MTREEAIDELSYIKESFAVCDSSDEALDMASKALEEPHWIPCSEQLPEESGKYFVTVWDGVGKRTTSAPYHPQSKSWTLTGRIAYWKVLAWMPQPEPWEGDAE